MNRFEKVATALTKTHGVHVEYVSANREYVVEGVRAGSAREADKTARQIAQEANNYAACRANGVRT